PLVRVDESGVDLRPRGQSCGEPRVAGPGYIDRVTEAPTAVREPGSLPFPDRPAGTPNEEMPFDHLVVVMMENHSFDNLLAALPLTRPDVDGLTFVNGAATNSNAGGPQTASVVTAFPLPSTAQGSDVSQTWKVSHEQINGGAMDGFVRTQNAEQPMGYYTP